MHAVGVVANVAGAADEAREGGWLVGLAGLGNCARVIGDTGPWALGLRVETCEGVFGLQNGTAFSPGGSGSIQWDLVVVVCVIVSVDSYITPPSTSVRRLINKERNSGKCVPYILPLWSCWSVLGRQMPSSAYFVQRALVGGGKDEGTPLVQRVLYRVITGL